jgi:hypothetical protein
MSLMVEEDGDGISDVLNRQDQKTDETKAKVRSRKV